MTLKAKRARVLFAPSPFCDATKARLFRLAEELAEVTIKGGEEFVDHIHIGGADGDWDTFRFR